MQGCDICSENSQTFPNYPGRHADVQIAAPGRSPIVVEAEYELAQTGLRSHAEFHRRVRFDAFITLHDGRGFGIVRQVSSNRIDSQELRPSQLTLVTTKVILNYREFSGRFDNVVSHLGLESLGVT